MKWVDIMLNLIKLSKNIKEALGNNGHNIDISVLQKGTRYNPNKLPHVLITVPSFEDEIVNGGAINRKYILSVRIAADCENKAFELAEMSADTLHYYLPLEASQMGPWRLISAESETFFEADAKVAVFHIVFSGEFIRGKLEDIL